MLRAFMTVANVFVTDTRWLSIFYLVSPGMVNCLGLTPWTGCTAHVHLVVPDAMQGASVVLVYLYYKWIPHLHAWVNHVRVASYAAIAWSSFLFVIVAFARGDDDSAANQRSQVSESEGQRQTILAVPFISGSWSGCTHSLNKGVQVSSC
jgi:hypothetical protein